MLKYEIILISGPQGSGKSTITEALRKSLEARKYWEAIELRFASAIYQMHDAIRDYMRSLGFHAPEKMGDLLQYLGTDFGRKNFGDDVWVNCVKSLIHNIQVTRDQLSTHAEAQGIKENLAILISDCRFRNEFDAFPEALRVRLQAPELVRKARAEAWRENTKHPSEVDLDSYAESGKFDLYLNTMDTPVVGCVTLIEAKLDKGGWVERRER